MPQVQEKHDEYELVPMSPLRRLEKRIELLEQSGTMDGKEFYRELVDIIRMNQQIVDELAKANDALRIEISKLPPRMEELISHMKELISFIKASANEEVMMGTDSAKPLNSKLEELVETNKKIVENNQAVLGVLEDLGRKLTMKPPMPTMPVRKPMLPPQQQQRTA